MKWKQNRDITSEYLNQLTNELGINSLLLRIFLNRVNDLDLARIALRDIHEAIIPPEKLVNGQAIADKISEHIRKNSKIYIHADYDSDGLNSGTIMYETIKEVIKVANSDASVEVYFPEREHGYGLSFYFADMILETHNKDRDNVLIITVDNGIAQIEQINTLIDNGIEVVVTDHHESKEEIPNCLICDPHCHQIEQDDTFHHLCGAGVAFKVGELLQKNFGYHDMYKFVVNVAIATITDVMPLTAENIAFIKYGLGIINSDMCPTGIQAMKEYLGLDIVNPGHIAWELGPRLNACGRMNNTKLGGQLLLENNYEVATGLVNNIELINDKRKELTKKAKEQLEKMDFSNDLVCIIKLEDIPEGIVGIIAGQAAEKFGKPSIVVTEHNGICKGSARTAMGLNLQELFAIETEKGNIINFGGHAEAAGVSFLEENINSLKESLHKSITNAIINTVNENKLSEYEPTLLIDECIEIKHLNKDTFNLINELPYNNDSFSKPVFALTDCKVKDYVPTASNPNNLWLTVQQGNQTLKLWCKDMTEVYKEKGCPNVVHLAGHIEKNFMSGRPYTLKVIDIADAS